MIEPEESKVWAVFLSSDIKLELLRLFHANPKLTSTSEEIEIWLIKKIGNQGSFCIDEDKDREIQAQITRYLLKGCNWTPRSCCETFC